MKWKITLSGDRLDLYELSKSLNDDNLTIYEKDNKFYLKSKQILSTDKYGEVSDKAKELVDLINGASKIALRTRNNISIEEIYKLKDDGKRILFFGSSEVSITTRVRISLQTIKLDGTLETHNSADSVKSWLELSKQNKIINKVFKLISNDSDSWVGLYKIYDLINKNDKISSFSSISTTKFKRFTNTANNYNAIGMKARHALDFKSPKNPMNIEEARTLIFLLVNEWLEQFQK
jgi:hypothetical protein